MGGKCIAQTLAMEDFMTEEAIASNRPCCVAAFASLMTSGVTALSINQLFIYLWKLGEIKFGQVDILKEPRLVAMFFPLHMTPKLQKVKTHTHT